MKWPQPHPGRFPRCLTSSVDPSSALPGLLVCFDTDCDHRHREVLAVEVDVRLSSGIAHNPHGELGSAAPIHSEAAEESRVRIAPLFTPGHHFGTVAFLVVGGVHQPVVVQVVFLQCEIPESQKYPFCLLSKALCFFLYVLHCTLYSNT